MRAAAILLSVLFGVAAAHADERALRPDESRLLSIYKQLIEINTTHSSGSTTRAAEAMAKRLTAAGFAAKDLQILGPQPNKKNLVLRWRGGQAQQPLLLLAHLDVVEARREDWSVDPFVLLEQDGYYYGRGTLDDKAMAAIFVATLIKMKQEHVKPNRDLILALTADEEGGPDNGVDWLLQHHRDLVDAALVLNEGGGGRIRDGKYLQNGVQASEKSFMTFRFEVRNKGGHSSLPTKDNAIYRLAAGLGRLEQYQFPIELNEVTRNYFERSAQSESGQMAADLKAILQDQPDADAVARLSQVPSYNATLRTTCVATRLEAGHADNALPQMARATVNCRILPGHTTDEVQRTLASVVVDEQIIITPTEPDTAAPAAPLHPALMQVIATITDSMWPGVPVIATMSTGATDSRFFRKAGVPAYGVSGLFVDMDDIRAHGKDERIGKQQFFESYEFLSRLVAALATGS